MVHEFIVHYRYTYLRHHGERKFFRFDGAIKSARAAEEFCIVRLSDNAVMVQTKGFVW